MTIQKAIPISVLIMAVAASACDPGSQSAPAAASEERKPLYYRNPMDPSVISDVPRKDSMGMDYVPVYASNGTPGEVRLSTALINNLAVRTAPVRRGALAAGTRTAGLTAYDERGRVEVRVRTEAYVERLAVRASGESVRRGQLLFAVFSPKLAAAQREFIAALEMGDEILAESAAARLQALGLRAAAIEALRDGGTPAERVSVYAPIDGVVIDLAVRDGGIAEPAISAMTLAPLDPLWVVADVPEAQASSVTESSTAVVTLRAWPGQRFEARVVELLPSVNAATRTVQARLALANPGLKFSAGMVADVTFPGATSGDALLVPLEALIRTGSAERVIVALGDGRFIARPVVAGRESGDEVEILSGLDDGERVVVSGQFMIDSESQLRSGHARYQENSAEAE
ncbi:MAG: efflux RND transporter periplasmic adaptor subunit [Steroidobacteraceae bacterium]